MVGRHEQFPDEEIEIGTQEEFDRYAYAVDVLNGTKQGTKFDSAIGDAILKDLGLKDEKTSDEDRIDIFRRVTDPVNNPIGRRPLREGEALRDLHDITVGRRIQRRVRTNKSTYEGEN